MKNCKMSNTKQVSQSPDPDEDFWGRYVAIWIFGLPALIFFLLEFFCDNLTVEKLTGYWLAASFFYWLICYPVVRVRRALKEIRLVRAKGIGVSKTPQWMVIAISLMVILAIVGCGVVLMVKYEDYAKKKAAIEKIAEIERGKKEELERPRRERESRQYEADSLVRALRYIKDPRTGVCFAYYSGYKTEMLATVPESAIPPDMLIVANVGKQRGGQD